MYTAHARTHALLIISIRNLRRAPHVRVVLP